MIIINKLINNNEVISKWLLSFQVCSSPHVTIMCSVSVLQRFLQRSRTDRVYLCRVGEAPLHNASVISGVSSTLSYWRWNEQHTVRFESSMRKTLIFKKSTKDSENPAISFGLFQKSTDRSYLFPVLFPFLLLLPSALLSLLENSYAVARFSLTIPVPYHVHLESEFVEKICAWNGISWNDLENRHKSFGVGISDWDISPCFLFGSSPTLRRTYLTFFSFSFKTEAVCVYVRASANLASRFVTLLRKIFMPSAYFTFNGVCQ